MPAAPNGIFPRNGVPPAEAAPGALLTAQSTCDELFYAAKCTPRIDVQSLNTIISEIVGAVNCAGMQYDCSRLDNLCRAMQRLVENGVCDTDTVATIASATVVLCTPGGIRRIAPEEFKAWLCSSSPVKTTIAASDYILSCTADGLRRISFSRILDLIPDDTDNYVDSADFGGGNLRLGRTGSLPDIVTPAPLNWRRVAEGTIQGAQFVDGWPNIPGSESDPGKPSDLPAGVKEPGTNLSDAQGKDFWINTGVPIPTVQTDGVSSSARVGIHGHFRAAVRVHGTVTAGSNGKPWSFECEPVPVTYWWGPHHMWIRFRPLIMPGAQASSIDVTSAEWMLEQFVLGTEAPY